MSAGTSNIHHALETRVADKYRRQGFEVWLEPQSQELPFDLGGYRPDLIAQKPPQENYIIEIKSHTGQASIDRLHEIAETVAQHQGWRFLFVTGDDISAGDEKEDGSALLTWEQILQRKAQAEHLVSLDEIEGAFLTLWAVFEALLRRQAQHALLPIERFPTLSLIKQLYSEGEIAIEQFDTALALQEIRNRFAHGYQTLDIRESMKQLQEMVEELIKVWKPNGQLAED